MGIYDILMSWGKGRPINSAPNGYPKSTAFARFIQNPGDSVERGDNYPFLPEDFHSRVDRIVTDMSNKKPDNYYVICYHYIGRKGDSEIAKKMRLSRSTVRSLRENGEHWIEAKLDGEVDTC